MEGIPADPGGLESDLAAFGIDADAASFESDEADYLVLPENWEALQLFLKCATQWRHAGMTGVRTGLDYPSVEAVMRITGVQDQADVFWRLQLIERGALEAFQDKQGQS